MLQTVMREKERSFNVGGLGGVVQNETDLLTMAIKALIIYTYTFALILNELRDDIFIYIINSSLCVLERISVNRILMADDLRMLI